MIGERADLAFGVQVSIRVVAHAVGGHAGIGVPVRPHFITADDDALDGAHFVAGLERLERHNSVPVANGLHTNARGLANSHVGQQASETNQANQKRTRLDSNQRHSVSKTDALSS